jgi:hypothetical protein
MITTRVGTRYWIQLEDESWVYTTAIGLGKYQKTSMWEGFELDSDIYWRKDLKDIKTEREVSDALKTIGGGKI